MKIKTITLIMSVLCILNAQAELKHFLPHSGGSISTFNTCLTKKHFFEGDTIIQEKRYTKVYVRWCETETEDECVYDENCFYFGAVREDSIAEKIYFLQWDYTEEKLLADFNVEAGDKLIVGTFQLPAIVKSVDSIEINGEYRKRISFIDQYSLLPQAVRDVWIEGIGSVVYGLFSPNPELIADGESLPVFLCLQTDNGFVYQNPNHNTCYLVTNCDPCVLHHDYWCCVDDCRALGGIYDDCWFYCVPPFPPWDDRYRLFHSCVRSCMDNGGEFGDCLSYCRAEYETSMPAISHKAFNISLSPTNDLLLVQTEHASCSYVIYNALGSVIKRGDLLNSYINISTFSPGIYYIVIYHKNNLILYTGQFIKQ